MVDEIEGISVVIPMFNSMSTIDRCLNSVLSQTLLPNEIIVIDNMSLDESKRLVENMARDAQIPIRLYDCQIKGSGAARNLGVSHATYNKIAFLDADDYWEPSKIECQNEIIEKSTFTLCGTRSNMLLVNGHKIGESFQFLNSHKAEQAIFGNGVLPFHLSTWVIRKRDFLSIGGFNNKYLVAQDFDFFRRALRSGMSITFVNKLLNNYVISENAISSKLYIDQFLSAEYLRSIHIQDEMSIEEFIVSSKSIKNRKYRMAKCGLYSRKSILSKDWFSRILFLILASVFSPTLTLRKIREHKVSNTLQKK